MCVGQCFDLTASHEHCGDCNNACASHEVCTSSACCPLGNLYCHDICRDVQSDVHNCGACDYQCPAKGQSCQAGKCVCGPGQIVCSGACTNTTTDPNNCGTCNHTCSPPACSSSACVTGFVYDEQFTSGVTYTEGTPQYEHWKTYLASLTGNYTTITLSGSLDTTGVTCNVPASVMQIVQALHAGTSAEVSCNGHAWHVGGCTPNNTGVALDGTLGFGNLCSCTATYAVFPMIGNPNWGGMAGVRCNAQSQEMKVFIN
jgi:hypothetical protein